jgi:hypothetical protein
MRFLLRYAVWFSLLLFAYPVCARAQNIKIRAINAEDGKPLAKQDVTVNLIYEKKENAPPNIEWTLHLSAGADGTVSLPLPAPAPDRLWVQVDSIPQHWRCACYVLANTQDVISKGLTLLGNWKMTPSVDAHPRPGQIVFSARPPTFFERLLDPFME